MEKDDLSPKAWERLKREQGYLMQARTLFKQADDDSLLQMAFAENTDPNDAVDVIRQFSLLVKKGITPPPHILAAVAQGFGKYISASGELSLDEAFGRRNVQGVKHPLKQRLKKEERVRVYWFIWYQRKQAENEGSEVSIYAAAAKAIEEFNLSILNGTLEKEYSAAKVEAIFEQAYEVMQDHGF
ncbi:MAG: hypothetical protein IPM27_06780 [Nitrosomonadales bacterium]|nr:hypothetical protein [Nitrosomonadales bacterium]